ncbi:MAG: transporter, family, macrolide efflux protein [Acidobacteriota bacterium]|jgi:MFS family permease|nr:transporter, family, macrolide efflux protein [Acidobacteriota bacterium]
MSYQRPVRLLNRDFVLLWQGQFVSMLGSQAFSVAMIFWIKRQTDSASLLGLGMLSQWVPAILLGPFGGTLADRMSRRQILILADVVRGIAAIALAALVLLVPGRSGTILVWLLILSAIMGVCDAFFRPAISASIPDLVPEEDVTRANSANRLALDVSTFLGQGSGGVLFRLIGPGILFLVDGVTYLFSAFAESLIRLPPPPPVPKTAGWREAGADFWRELKLGLRYMATRKGLRYVVFLAPLDSFFMITIVVLLPFYVEDFLHVTPDWYGFLVAAFGGGSLVGSLVAGATKLTGRRRTWAYLACAAGFGAAAIAFGFARSPWVAMALIFAAGVMSGFNTIQALSLAQLTTPSELRGRVLGLLETLGLSTMPLAAATAGIVADLVHRNIPLVYFGCGVALVVVALVLAGKREVREFLAHEPSPEPAAAAVTESSSST